MLELMVMIYRRERSSKSKGTVKNVNKNAATGDGKMRHCSAAFPSLLAIGEKLNGKSRKNRNT